MSRYFAVAMLNILQVTTAGCSQHHAQEIDARLESAENNAAWARLRADEAFVKAQHTADDPGRFLSRGHIAWDSFAFDRHDFIGIHGFRLFRQ